METQSLTNYIFKAYYITCVCFYGYEKMLRYGTFLSKCSQPFVDLLDVIKSKKLRHPTRTAEDVVRTTNGLQQLTQLIEWDDGKTNSNIDSN